MFSETEKIAQLKAFVWAGWDNKKLDRAVRAMAARPTRKINN
jgi:hypothetical protein